MKKLSTLIIILGIVILLFPTTKQWYEDRQQQKLLEEALKSLSVTTEQSTPQSLEEGYDQLSQIFDEADEEAFPDTSILNTEGAVAIISIPKINVLLPILEGATESNMKVAAVHMSETPAIGEVGNAAIAAHRARKAGRLFNRLDELIIGDTIDIMLYDQKLTYAVDDISTVLPTDMSVLEPKIDNKKEIILITCTPLVDPTHRLIIHATIVE